MFVQLLKSKDFETEVDDCGQDNEVDGARDEIAPRDSCSGYGECRRLEAPSRAERKPDKGVYDVGHERFNQIRRRSAQDKAGRESYDSLLADEIKKVFHEVYCNSSSGKRRSFCYHMAMEGLHVSLSAYHIGTLWGLPITSTLLTSWTVVALLLISAVLIGRSLKLVPGKGQVAVEMVLTGAFDYVAETLENKELAKKYFPLIMTMFLFIVAGNLIGLLPFVGPVGIHNATGEHGGLTPLLYPMNTDLNIPLALAIVAFIAIEFAGITALGVFKYAGKFLNFHSFVGFWVGLIELISELARLITFSFRLFGNIFAGKVLLLLALSFIPYLLPVPLLVYEVFVGVIQAIIFALLTLFFIKIAVTPVGEH